MTDLPIELHNATSTHDGDKSLYSKAKDFIRELNQGHTDINFAAINLTQPSQDNETAYIFAATVALYVRPNNISATQEAGSAEAALKGALEAAARQVREKRERRRDH